MHHNYRTRMLDAAMATAILFGLGLMAAWWSDGSWGSSTTAKERCDNHVGISSAGRGVPPVA